MLALHIGETEAALTILADIRHRHDGTRRSPWNEVECGDHYVRPMASWTLLEEAMGYWYDAVTGSLAFAPKFESEAFEAFFVIGTGWGTVRMDREGMEIHVDYGIVSLSRLELGVDGDSASAELSGQTLNIGISADDGGLKLDFISMIE